MAKKVTTEELQIIEALLLASEDILTQSKLNVCFDGDSAPSLTEGAHLLQVEYEKTGRAFTIEKAAGGYRLSTLPQFAPWIRRMLTRAGKTPLSQAALESLAVVAYKGPATRAELENIRGVSCAGVIKTLLDKKLVRISGRAKGPGRPLLYAVTDAFLLSFGLDSTADLPKLKEISELIAEGVGDGEAESGGDAAD
ncbi:MAG: SMC-Scp complex subunit ScpB [Candidatus Marinimicrobia bacterium]|nr:SMC-Scp complex subunit ScpB [Candidatus Neomarinimicrobiota bacterium]